MTPVSSFVEQMLNLTARRQQAIGSNIANLDTPGYHATDLNFDQELSSTLDLSVTSPAHLSLQDDPSSSHVYQVKSSVKPNGNNVDLEREMTELTKNGLQYVTLVQYLNQKLRTLRSSINEGGRV